MPTATRVPSTVLIRAPALADTKAPTAPKTSTNASKVGFVRLKRKCYICTYASLNRLLTVSKISGSPCEHDGICVNTPGSFACNCTQGFTGPRCETNINECESHPCKNDGSCLDDPGTFRCVCMPGESSISRANIESWLKIADIRPRLSSSVCLCLVTRALRSWNCAKGEALSAMCICGRRSERENLSRARPPRPLNEPIIVAAVTMMPATI